MTHFCAVLDRGEPPEVIIAALATSEEFRTRNAVLPRIELPDLIARNPSRYVRDGDLAVFRQATDADLSEFERLIHAHRFYDSFGVYSPKIDRDKELIAETVIKLGGRRCLEIGCFTGPVLSVLKDAGLTVTGVDASHLAFLLAYQNVHADMIFGDLLDVTVNGQFDIVLAMDILEHFNPTKLPRYLERIVALLAPNGYLVLNSPMFGPDRVFGNPFPAYLDAWDQVGDASFWRDIPCQAGGWPQHGHLIWASPVWWESALLKHGLRRDMQAEDLYHRVMDPNYAVGPARRTTFVLRTM
jgi:SAM-dependent methyltransferase